MKKLMTVLVVGSAFAMGSVAVAAKDDAPKAEKKDKKASKKADKAAPAPEGDKPAETK